MRRAVLALCLVACSGTGPQRVGSQPSWRHSDPAAKPVAPVRFAPSSEPATRYNEPLQAPPHTPLGDAVTQAVREAAQKANLPPPIADARLFRACAEIAEVTPEDSVVGYNVVEFALQRNGIIEPSPHLLVVWGDIDATTEILDQLRPHFTELFADGGAARLGIGVAKRNPDGTGAVVFALQGSGITTTPIPRALPDGGALTIDAVVDQRYHDPEVFVTHDDGSTERAALQTGKSGAFKSTLACGSHTGRQQVEITASDQAGATVLANFPVWCRAQPPAALILDPAYDDTAVTDPAEAEKKLLALLNRDRTAAGLQPLLWDERVAQVARGHSEEMRRTKIVAHISPTTGSAADRVKAANIRTAVVLENVARAYGVTAAHAALMNSPGHRANLMSPQVTHVGIGVVLGDEASGRRELLLTQVFIRIPPKVDVPTAAGLVRQRLQGARNVAVNAALSSIAQQLADGLAAGKTRDQLWPTARKKLDAMANVYARVGSVVTAVTDLDTIDGKELIADSKPDDIGIGVAQGFHPDIGEGAIWIVVLMAERLPARH